jgi:hypothetical protein
LTIFRAKDQEKASESARVIMATPAKSVSNAIKITTKFPKMKPISTVNVGKLVLLILFFYQFCKKLLGILKDVTIHAIDVPDLSVTSALSATQVGPTTPRLSYAMVSWEFCLILKTKTRVKLTKIVPIYRYK